MYKSVNKPISYCAPVWGCAGGGEYCGVAAGLVIFVFTIEYYEGSCNCISSTYADR